MMRVDDGTLGTPYTIEAATSLTEPLAWAALFTTNPAALFRHDGQGHFTRMTPTDVGPLASERSGAYVSCWGDYDNDGWHRAGRRVCRVPD